MTDRIRGTLRRFVVGLCCSWLAASLGGGELRAQDAQFYKGKTVSVAIGYPAGGGYDATARLLIRHMPRHIPDEPSMIPQNMPGAGSQRAANYLFNIAPKDGTAFGIVGGYIPFQPLWNSEGAQYEATKFNWLGSLDRWNGLALVWHTAPAVTFEQAKQKEVLIGATGSTDIGAIYPKVVNALFGTKFKVVSGYQGTPDLNLAIERGEVHGRFGLCWQCLLSEKPNWVAENKVAVPLMIGVRRTPEMDTVPQLKGAPLIMELARNDEERQILNIVFGSQELSRPFFAPPGVPADRIAILRAAFEAAAKDPALLAEAQKLKQPINVLHWQELEKLIADVYATPKPVVARAAAIINGN